MACALKWGVTHVGDYHYWALLTLSRDHYFKYKECIVGQHSLEAAFEKKAELWLWYFRCITCIRILNLNMLELRVTY